MINSRIRVLLVDDSAVIRKIVAKALQDNPQIEVIGFASNGEEAIKSVELLIPDVVILDIEMPKMNGIQALKEIRKNHKELPIIMFSSSAHNEGDTAIEAFSCGASDCVAKPDYSTVSLLDARRIVQTELVPRIINLSSQNLSRRKLNLRASKNQEDLDRTNKVKVASLAGGSHLERLNNIRAICIGSSTGGPMALIELLKQIKPSIKVPIFIVQHMPESFTASLAARLDAVSNIKVKEATHGENANPGVVYIARGGQHMTLAKVGIDVAIRFNNGAAVNNCRPSVDVLFRSASQIYGSEIMALILTGMGSDGLDGCHEIAKKDGLIYVQNEESSVVWGMPGSVAQAGLASRILSIDELAEQINLCSFESGTIPRNA